jgi:aspartyl-tRNA(Asn)/glutamyl-tRNA(Gln) amidotransferase subunit A
LKSYDSFQEIRSDLYNGAISCRELVKKHLTHIRNKAHLNVFLSVFDEEALERASIIDKKIRDKKLYE